MYRGKVGCFFIEGGCGKGKIMAQSDQIGTGLKWEIKRKSFHLLGLVYVVGLLILPRTTFLMIVTSLFIGVLIVEIIRLRTEAINVWILDHFGGIFRKEERRKISGVFWMLAGVVSSVVLLDSWRLSVTAILYLILGDAAASLVGKYIGGPKWMRSEKSLVGSLACFSVCVLIGMFLMRPLYPWYLILAGALVATAAEAGPFSNDNFSIPCAASLLFTLF